MLRNNLSSNALNKSKTICWPAQEAWKDCSCTGDAVILLAAKVLLPEDLLPEVLAKQRLVQIRLLLKVQGDKLGGSALLAVIPDLSQQRMCQRLLDNHALAGVEAQHAFEEVHRAGLRMRQAPLQAAALALGEAPEVAPGVLPLQLRDVLIGGRPQQVEDHAQLVVLTSDVVLVVVPVLVVRGQWEARRAREEGAPVLHEGAIEHAQELRVDAADGPHVDGCGIAFLQ
mmetsp:Transcript_116189/g.369741  ORF Transcript_116189/g.369741 Transcript_116189/m.369741 type:complete len:228 (-) Transcript_116189:724-1407(-)